MSEGETKNKGGSSEEVLEKAIQKAIDGGWEGLRIRKDFWSSPSGYGQFYRSQTVENLLLDNGFKILLFNHDFAKALWGEDSVLIDVELRPVEDPIYTDAQEPFAVTQPAWQYHLQQMVIADDPIKYLGENI